MRDVAGTSPDMSVVVNVWERHAKARTVHGICAQYDFGNPNTFSPMKLRISCGLIGAMRGIITSRR